jgi:hypothetical protein
MPCRLSRGRIPHEKLIGWRDVRLCFISARQAGLLIRIERGVWRGREHFFQRKDLEGFLILAPSQCHLMISFLSEKIYP